MHTGIANHMHLEDSIVVLLYPENALNLLCGTPATVTISRPAGRMYALQTVQDKETYSNLASFPLNDKNSCRLDWSKHGASGSLCVRASPMV